MRVKNGVEPINHTADTARGGSRPKPPKAVAQRASLEAPGAVSEHQTAKRRLTAKTVALDSAKRWALGTHYFKGVDCKGSPFAGGPGGKATGRVSGRSPDCQMGHGGAGHGRPRAYGPC
jgi:hypothetical protein